MKAYKVTVNGTAYEITLEAIDAADVKAAPAVAAAPAPASAPAAAPAGGETVNAPMPGNVLDIKVANGASVKKGDVLIILEAMKMENEIMAPCDGTVNVVVTKGSAVETGAVLCTIA
ncbi:MAG: biotin/lipoyl-binding protein [Ruminococcaceae bacterium]|nr:biotin/lipoyl-binding protein [Oscillospiraceae bacterium]